MGIFEDSLSAHLSSADSTTFQKKPLFAMLP